MYPQDDDKTWYNDLYRSEKDTNLIIPQEIRDRYSRLLHPKLYRLEMWYRLIGNIAGKKILFLGCGIETSPVLLALRGGEIWTMDLAQEALRRQKDLALANGTAKNTHLLVGSCEQLPVASGAFDLVVGIGILHHLQAQMDKACLEIGRVLKAGGFAIFEEPISLSAMLKRLRERLPLARLPDASPICRPLDEKSMASLDRHFAQESYYYALFARFDRFVYGGEPSEFAPWWKNWASMGLHLFDYFLLAVPGLKRRLASQIVFRLTPLKKGQAYARPDGFRAAGASG